MPTKNAIKLLSCLVVFSSFAAFSNPPQLVQTASDKIFSIGHDHKLHQVWFFDDGEMIGSEEAQYDTATYGQPLRLAPYGRDSVIVYTTKKNLLVKRYRQKEVEIIGTDWNVKDMAVIEDSLFILGTNGNLNQKNIVSKKTTPLLTANEWKDVSRMIALGTNLVTFTSEGALFRVDPQDTASAYKFGVGFHAEAQIAALDNERVVLVSPNNTVHAKNAMNSAYKKIGEASNAMEIDNMTLLEPENFFVVRKNSLTRKAQEVPEGFPFSVQSVINHTKSRPSDYNIDLLESAGKRRCIEDTIRAIFVTMSYPERIVASYGKHYRFKASGYTKSVIAHYCGGPL